MPHNDALADIPEPVDLRIGGTVLEVENSHPPEILHEMMGTTRPTKDGESRGVIENEEMLVTELKPFIELAKRLVPSSFADRLFFTNSGTKATEAAIKFARKFQRTLHSEKQQPPF
ncbi:hypothetical protein LIER_17521 [Lithospermum erythrorhizon]|uniref:Aminotransferase class V domain-containing protein n=1 Tax=Lithospermum erythrorhizon TaxID=34254 RepID=A0AAV3QD08_LITER